jgi:hypothetical protein
VVKCGRRADTMREGRSMCYARAGLERPIYGEVFVVINCKFHRKLKVSAGQMRKEIFSNSQKKRQGL